MKIQVACDETAIVRRTVEILTRVLRDRGVRVERTDATPEVILDVQAGIGAEGFRIEGRAGEPVTITGNDERGLLYGVGRFLHTSRYDEPGFSPSPWRGTSVPTSHVRGMYPAYNFLNWYVEAPRAEVLRYAEDLALWGINAMAFVTAHHQRASMDAPMTPELKQTLDENLRLMESLRGIGMRIGVLSTGNIGFAHAPAGSEARDVPDTDPPHRGNVGPRVCPSHPAGWAHMEKTYAAVLDSYRDVGLDYIVTFPYDAGGCGCERCWPWGARGFLKLNQMISRLMRERFPDCRLVYGTWCFDALGPQEGEWDGLAKALDKDSSWVHYIMADSHEDFPRHPLEKGVPGGLPLLNFPEITMWGRYPWGGYGANPLPARFQRLWDQIKHLCDGGFPYSEGIFEDMNKAVVSQFYWDRDRKAADTLRDYAGFEFGSRAAADVVEAAFEMEKSYPEAGRKSESVERAFELTTKAEAAMPAWARVSWRWRILACRARIDLELKRSGGVVTDACDAAYEELTAIYHAERAGGPVTPRSRRNQARFSRVKQAPPPPGAVG